MSSKFYVHGPAQIFVSTAGPDDAQTYEFLGLSESQVAPDFEGLHVDESADYAGMMPGDVSFQGELATVPMILKRFNYPVYAKLAARIRGATRGAIGACALGTLMMTEKKMVGLIVKGPYAVCKSAFYGELPVGFRFPFAYLAGTISEPFSTRAMRVPIVFRCMPQIDPTANGTGILFDVDMTPVAGVPVN